jgi:type VI secretion system protein ImpJ
MKASKKVLWSEGILLSQQHFQQWDKQIEGMLFHMMKQCQPFFWGVHQLRIDESALLVGRCCVKQCYVIFPEGQIISYEANEKEILSCELPQNISSEKLNIYLCMSLGESVSGINGMEAETSLRAGMVNYDMIRDIYNPEQEREVGFVLPKLVLLREDENRDQYLSLKIAELSYGGSLSYQVEKNFIPATPLISSSSELMMLSQRFLNLIQSKIHFIQEKRQHENGGLSKFGTVDLPHSLLLQALAHSLPFLQSMQDSSMVHPRELYLEMKRLIAVMQAISTRQFIETEYVYQHDQLSNIFSQLEIQFQMLINEVIPSRLGVLRLNKVSEFIYSVGNAGAALAENGELYLAVKMPTGNAHWIIRFIQQVKIASDSALSVIIGSALPGLKLTYVQHLPNYFPAKSGYEYFLLNKAGECWEKVKLEKNIAMFVPKEFASATLEFLSVGEN